VLKELFVVAFSLMQLLRYSTMVSIQSQMLYAVF